MSRAFRPSAADPDMRNSRRLNICVSRTGAARESVARTRPRRVEPPIRRASIRPGDYLFFDALLPPARIAETLHAKRASAVWADGRMMFDRSSVQNLPTGLESRFRARYLGELDGRPVTAFGGYARRRVNVGEFIAYHRAPRDGTSSTPTPTTAMRRSVPRAPTTSSIRRRRHPFSDRAAGRSERTALELWVDGRRVRADIGTELRGSPAAVVGRERIPRPAGLSAHPGR